MRKGAGAKRAVLTVSCRRAPSKFWSGRSVPCPARLLRIAAAPTVYRGLYRVIQDPQREPAQMASRLGPAVMPRHGRLEQRAEQANTRTSRRTGETLMSPGDGTTDVPDVSATMFRLAPRSPQLLPPAAIVPAGEHTNPRDEGSVPSVPESRQNSFESLR